MTRTATSLVRHHSARLGAALAAAVALTACQSSGDPASTETPSGPSETTTTFETTSSAATPPPAVPVTDLVLVRCAEDAISLAMLDPATATEEPIADFTLVGSPASDCTRLRDYSSLVLQTMFDPSFARLAISIEGETDGGAHVGWQHADGSVVDVTAAIAEAGGPTASEAEHDDPMFGTDGSFQFVDEATGELVSYAVDGQGEISGTGTRTAIPPGQGRVVATPWGAPWTGFFDEPGARVCLSYPGPSGLFSASLTEFSPQVWISATEYLQIELTAGQTIARAAGLEVPAGSPGVCPSAGSPLFAAADREIGSLVLSPDQTQVAFLSDEGAGLALSVVPVAGGEPTPVGAVDAAGTVASLAAWR